MSGAAQRGFEVTCPLNVHSMKLHHRSSVSGIYSWMAASAILATLALGAGCRSHRAAQSSGGTASAPQGIQKVGHIVVIYMENHSFDNLYGQFDGADGISNATASQITQIDKSGNPYTTLPVVRGGSGFPTNLPNTNFNIDQYVHSDKITPDVSHAFYNEQLQIDSGRMDKYAAYNASGALTMGYYTTDLIPLAAVAKQYTLCDRFFQSAFGGSYLNHIWLISARTPEFPGAPDQMVSKFDSTGHLKKEGSVTPDGFSINTSYSVNTPHPAKAKPEMLVPYQTYANIGDRLSEKNISWTWYAWGWDSAMAGTPNAEFAFHHQPFIYFKNYAEGTQAKKDHLKDETDFFAAATNGTLPAVSFVKPGGPMDEHPGSSDVVTAETHAVAMINAVLNGPDGKDAVIILTYDENGGFWDHVVPPTIDRWGPGNRIPAIIISPFAKKGFVDHTQYETVSILSFIEKRYGLQPLTERDKNAAPLQNAFDF